MSATLNILIRKPQNQRTNKKETINKKGVDAVPMLKKRGGEEEEEEKVVEDHENKVDRLQFTRICALAANGKFRITHTRHFLRVANMYNE